MKWREKPLDTIGDVLRAATSCQTPEDAESLLAVLKAENPEHAESNLGYMLGYCGLRERERLYKLFASCNHPVFGSGFGRGNDPTTEEALNAGIEAGKAAREGV